MWWVGSLLDMVTPFTRLQYYKHEMKWFRNRPSSAHFSSWKFWHWLALATVGKHNHWCKQLTHDKYNGPITEKVGRLPRKGWALDGKLRSDLEWPCGQCSSWYVWICLCSNLYADSCTSAVLPSRLTVLTTGPFLEGSPTACIRIIRKINSIHCIRPQILFSLNFPKTGYLWKAYIVLYSWMWWCYMAATCRDGSIEHHPWTHSLLHPVSCNCPPEFIYLPISTNAFHLSM